MGSRAGDERAAEMIKVEMLNRIAHGSNPSNEVARGLGLQHQGG
jgi:hypothetical protein